MLEEPQVGDHGLCRGWPRRQVDSMVSKFRTLTRDEAFRERVFPDMLSLDIRLTVDSRTVLNAQVVELLGAIKSEGTLGRAANRLRIPYKKALGLLAEANQTFEEPLVATHKGGVSRGGSVLTEGGECVLDAYTQAITVATAAALEELDRIALLLKRRLREKKTSFVEYREYEESPD